ncbi:MAG: exodeoxyribonuclease VII small subunit [Chloroflexi bacterium]|jgi:exodeoxyribonuclease VII small subunit|nr:exodeoxyribonuclease VII small subunit [Chloroflexota bacterium]
MTKKLPPVNELTYEQALAELEGLLSLLETDDGGLDEILAKFERGQALVQHCAALLEKAELKVRQLSGDEIIDFEADA